MKKTLAVLFATLLASGMLLAACSSSTSSTPAATGGATSTVATAASTAEGLVLTVDELAAYNGKDGQPAYIAVDGVIYDVTDVPAWAGGEHNGHQAGQDLTDAIKNDSPHGTSVLDDLPVVGTLAS